MSETLSVRVYNVRFGDAILVTVPDRDPRTHKTTIRRILIDVGNAPKVAGSGEGGGDEVFEAVVTDILKVLGGKPLDLYVMTHEHLDHVQGLFYAATKVPVLKDVAKRMKVRHAWFTASSDPKYYDDPKHAKAKEQHLAAMEMYARVAADFNSHPAAAEHRLMEVLANNDPTKTSQCVSFLQKELCPGKLTYIHRGVDLKGQHSFKEAKFETWAPEEDTSIYYGRFQPLDKGAVPLAATRARRGATKATGPKPSELIPPQGVDVGSFLQLVEARRGGVVDNLLAIDKAANNTSIVFTLEWRGWRLLFAGDAEDRSWKEMNKQGVLKPVHFLKISHHGSSNGTPKDDLLESILPLAAPDARPRAAAVSTWRDTYGGIPSKETDDRIDERVVKRHSTLDHLKDLFYEVTFDG